MELCRAKTLIKDKKVLLKKTIPLVIDILY